MEQYELPYSILLKDLKYCLKNYKAERIFIRPVGSRKDLHFRLDENLEDKTLEVKQVKKGLSILIDGEEKFLFEQKKSYTKGFVWGKHFSVGYERYPNEKGVIPMLPTGINPDDPNLPPVRISSFRCVNSDYFLQLFFEGKIPLKFNSWKDKEIDWKYWRVKRKASNKRKKKRS